MKHTLLILAVFSLAITALHAQVLPGTIPGVDPAVQAAVDAAVPKQYAAYAGLALIALMWLGRAVPVLQKGSGLIGWCRAVLFGTNTPHVLIACFSLLALSSCDTPKTAAEAAKRQRYEAIGDRLLTLGTNLGYVTPAEAAEIRDIGALVIPTNPPPVIETTSGK